MEKNCPKMEHQFDGCGCAPGCCLMVCRHCGLDPLDAMDASASIGECKAEAFTLDRRWVIREWKWWLLTRLHDAEVRRRDEFDNRGCLIAGAICIAIWAIGFIGIFYL